MKKSYFFSALLCFFLIDLSCQEEINDISSDSILRLGVTARNNYNYKDAILYGQQLLSKPIIKDSSYYKFIASDFLWHIHDDIGDSIRAKRYGTKSLKIALESKIDSLITWAYLNQGLWLVESENDLDKGIGFIKKSLKINETKDINPAEVFLTKVNLAWIYLDEGQNQKALEYLESIDPDTNTYQPYADYLLLFKYLKGHYYLKTKAYNKAYNYLTTALNMVGDDDESASDICGDLVEYYKYKGDYKNALLYLEKKSEYDEKLNNAKNMSALANASAKFDVITYKKSLKAAEKEKQQSEALIKKANDLNTILGVMLSAFIVVSAGLLFLFVSRRKYVVRLNNKNKELEKTKEETERLAKVKSQFLSTVSHELRTPLYGVIGITSMLQEDIKSNKHKQELDSLKFSADYLLALINDVLLINKMDYQNLTLDKVPFKLSQIIGNIQKSFEYVLKQNNNKLILNIDPEIPDNLIGSSVRISQILMNLVGNATKFNENGTIWLTIKLNKKSSDDCCSLFFEVKDDGIGIAKDKQAGIFKEFTQIGNDNYSHKGSGLGLSIVKKLLKLHDSKIRLESELGKGSSFSFQLNLFENKNVDQTRALDLNAMDNESIKKAHVLVVDDNRINLKITERMLSKHNMTSDFAINGIEAVDLAKANDYDIILMDINMPEMDGIEASRIIRTFNKTVPIIALTALDYADVKPNITSSNLNDVLSKPYEESQFIITIINHLKGRSNKSTTLKPNTRKNMKVIN